MIRRLNCHNHICFRSILLASLVLLATGAIAQKKHKAIFVIADGIPADVVERVSTPFLDEIARAGGYARAYVGGEKDGYSETPTISAVGYNSLLTGTWVNKHNVWDNDIARPNYNYWNIFRLFKQQFPKKTIAVFSTWLDNRTKLVGSEAAAAGSLQPDFYFDGKELDTIAYPHDTAGYFYHLIDEAVTDTAANYIKFYAPDLSWVYLEFTDEMGHRHGDGPALDNAVQKIDQQMGRLWKAIQYRQENFNEEWSIWITTDHGREASGYHHGGQSPRERTTWIVTNAKQLNKRFTDTQPAIVDIMPSIADFLGVKIPRNKLVEIDGVKLTGNISATNLSASLQGKSIDVSWQTINPAGKAKIWLALTNHFQTGGSDKYALIKEVPVSAGRATINNIQVSKFYKIVVELPYNFLNRWIVIGKPTNN